MYRDADAQPAVMVVDGLGNSLKDEFTRRHALSSRGRKVVQNVLAVDEDGYAIGNRRERRMARKMLKGRVK